MSHKAAKRETALSTGYRLLQVTAISQLYEIVDPEEVEPVEEEVGTVEGKPLRSYWDWHLAEGQEFQVLFGVWLLPSQDRPDEARVTYLGRFEIGKDVATIKLKQFAHKNAAAILFPYIRRAISHLTGEGPFGRIDLDPINIVRLMERHHPFEASSGARQLQERQERKKAEEAEEAGEAEEDDDQQG
jgi:preprotein translocase subunit SecB